MFDNSSGYKGALDPSNGANEFAERDFQIRQILAQTNIGTVVRIVAVSNNGGLAPVGLVDVVPMILQRDGYGNVVEGNTIHDVPYFRLQGGTRAVIIDPVVGDIGIAIFADRDISSVIATRADSLPGSYRRNDMADALYIGGVLNGTPTSVLRLQGNDVHVQCPGKFIVEAAGGAEIHAPTIALDGVLTQGSGTYPGTATFSNSVSFTGASVRHNSKNIGDTHNHPVTTAPGTTDAPNP